MKRFLCAAVLLVGTAATGSAQDIPLSKILVEGQGWHEVAKDLPKVTYLAATPNGSIEIDQGMLSARLTANGKVEKVAPTPEKDEDRSHKITATRTGAIYRVDAKKVCRS
jgi:hypothetical protein